MDQIPNSVRNICLVLGDQLNHDSELFSGFEPKQDVVAFFEVTEESVQEGSSKQRTVLFLSAMRHFAQELKEKDLTVHYVDIRQNLGSIFDGLADLTAAVSPEKIRVVLPGDSRLLDQLNALTDQLNVPFEVLPDNHFISKPGQFSQWVSRLKQPRMEHWYRYIRKDLQILMADKTKPVGGKWNYDQDNRKSFGKSGPSSKGLMPNSNPDEITLKVIEDVKTYLPLLPGKLDQFLWPVNRAQALTLLDQFIEERLTSFGAYQDAMWVNEPFLYHAWISSSLNLKLLNPREVIEKAVDAYEKGVAPLNAVEGFIRQVLGWREYVRGLYWTHRQDWSQMNALEHHNQLPAFYWDADTEMNCLRQSISQVLEYGYGHHIQRLMVTGLFALLAKVDPQQVHRWYLSMYVDAVAWVEIPNTIGMSQFADGGILASKPYIASGNYIKKMSNYCSGCRFNPSKAYGEDACPFTTLYWAFVHDKEALLSANPRLAMQVKHWKNKSAEDQQKILQQRSNLIEALQIEPD